MKSVQWRLDDEVIACPTCAVINANRPMIRQHPGFFNICVHKGLQANLSFPGGPDNTLQNGNPDDIVKAPSDWPQFHFIIYHSCFMPAFWDLQALLDILNEAGSMAPTTLTDSDRHVVPNIRWSTQLAQIAGGKYVAGAEPISTSPPSTRRLSNVDADLGMTMASMITIFPTVFAHLIGQELYYMGSEHIVLGTDSTWYGGPQWQIEALWRFQIPEQMHEKWHYPALTDKDKRNILGLGQRAVVRPVHGRETRAVGQPCSPYKTGNPPRRPAHVQPGSPIDTVLQGVGYPTPVAPVNLIPSDNITKVKADHIASGAGLATPRAAGSGQPRTHALAGNPAPARQLQSPATPARKHQGRPARPRPPPRPARQRPSPRPHWPRVARQPPGLALFAPNEERRTLTCEQSDSCRADPGCLLPSPAR